MRLYNSFEHFVYPWNLIWSYRPQFSLDVRTKSFDGLLFHITGKEGVPAVILSLTDGKVKLSVGGDQIISSHKIDNGDWHNVRTVYKLRRLKWCVTAKSQLMREILFPDQVRFETKQLLSSRGRHPNTWWTVLKRVHPWSSVSCLCGTRTNEDPPQNTRMHASYSFFSTT